MTQPNELVLASPDTVGAPADVPRSEALNAGVSILDTIDVPIVVVDRDGKVSRFNRAATATLGLSTSDVGRLPRNSMALNELKELEKLCAQVIGEGVPCRTELRERDRWFLVQIAPCTGKVGEIGGAVLTFTNVTAFRASMEQAIYEREYTKAILNTVNYPLVLLDCELRVQTANRAFYAMLGVSREATRGAVLCDLGNQHWKSLSLWTRLKTSFSDHNEVHGLEVEVEFPAIGRRTLLLDAGWLSRGGLQMRLLAFRDITERKRMEEQLREREERYRKLFDLGPIAVYSCDASGVICEYNKRAAELWGRKPEPGDTDERFCGSFKLFRRDGTFMPHEQCPMADVLCGRIGGTYDAEVVIERPDGSRVIVIVNIAPLVGERGEITGAINCFYDVTERNQTEEKLLQAKEQLTDQADMLERIVKARTAELIATNKELEALVYSIAHDLRAPLRGMEGFSAMLVEEAGAGLSDKSRQFANRIRKAAQCMDALLLDLLAFSQIRKGRIDLEPINLELGLKSVLRRLEPEMRKKKARVDADGPWPTVLAHSPTLMKVLMNLIGNALKFVAPGTQPAVRICAEERGQTVRLWVEDNGIGIPAGCEAQIFGVFTRLHGDKYPGTGIGLAIVKKAVECMGGHVGVESSLGQGSRFWFELRKLERN